MLNTYTNTINELKYIENLKGIWKIITLSYDQNMKFWSMLKIYYKLRGGGGGDKTRWIVLVLYKFSNILNKLGSN